MKGLNLNGYECKYLYRLLEKQLIPSDDFASLTKTWKNEAFNSRVRKIQKELRRHADEVYDIEIKENDNE